MRKRYLLLQLQSLFWLVLPWNALYQVVRRHFFRVSQLATFEGIVLTTMLPRAPENEAFVQATTEALRLLQRNAPRHYRRVVRYTRFICNHPLSLRAAQWEHWHAACVVDFSHFAPLLSPDHEDRDWHLVRYAMLLVHEATHGRQFALFFRHTKTTYLRIERLCTREELRVLQRLWSWDDLEERECYFQQWQSQAQSRNEAAQQLSLGRQFGYGWRRIQKVWHDLYLSWQ